MLYSPPSPVRSTSSPYPANQEPRDIPNSSSSAKSTYYHLYLRQSSKKLISQFLHFWSFFNCFDHPLLFVMKGFDLELGILIGNSNTFSLLESTIRSAIIRRSKGSWVFWEMLRMVAPKGWRLKPSDLKFSMSRKRATIRWMPLSSWVRPQYVEIEHVAECEWSVEDGHSLTESGKELTLDFVYGLLFQVEDVEQLLKLFPLQHLKNINIIIFAWSKSNHTPNTHKNNNTAITYIIISYRKHASYLTNFICTRIGSIE